MQEAEDGQSRSQDRHPYQRGGYGTKSFDFEGDVRDKIAKLLGSCQVKHKDNTAMVRVRMSVPLCLAIKARVVTKATTILDYGCGRGHDARFLRQRGFNAIGYDPKWGDFLRCNEKNKEVVRYHGLYVETPEPRDVVLLSYVLCVIESLRERVRVLKAAYALAKKALVVTVRDDFSSFKNCTREKDGFRTSSNSFQRPYKAKEFRDFVAKVLKQPVRQLASGVLVVSKE